MTTKAVTNELINDMLDYEELCGLVFVIDPRAAQFLTKDCPTVENFEYSGNLYEVMDWGESPQGHLYWAEVYAALVDREEQAPWDYWAVEHLTSVKHKKMIKDIQYTAFEILYNVDIEESTNDTTTKAK